MLKIVLEDLDINRNYQDDRKNYFNMYCKSWLHINDSDDKIHRFPLYLTLDERGAVVVKKDETSPMVNLILSFPGTAIANDDNVETLKNFSNVDLRSKTISDVKNQIENFIECLQPLIYV